MTIPTPQPRRVLVAYVYEDTHGADRFDRIWIDGMADLRTLEEVLKTEQLIAVQKDVNAVRIINWQPLEA